MQVVKVFNVDCMLLITLFKHIVKRIILCAIKNTMYNLMLSYSSIKLL